MKTITRRPIHDTTARTKQKQASNASLAKTLDHMIEGCQIISPDFRYIYVNQTVSRQGHQSSSHLVGRTMMEVYPGIEQTEMFTYLKRCLKRRKLQRLENEFTFPDGSKGWFELKMEPVPEGVLIFSEDISKRKNVEEALNRRNKKLETLTKKQERTRRELLAVLQDLRGAKDEINLEKTTDQAMLENLGEGLIAIDSKARIMMVNKTAEKLLGRKAAEVRGASITKLPMVDADGRQIPAAERPIHAVLRDGATVGPSFTGYCFVHKDKGKFPTALTITPIRLEGKIIGAIQLFRDISKEQEIDKAKTEFVSIASHQLRTPLGLAKWYLAAMQEEGLENLSKVSRGYFDEIYRSNERVLKVVRELLSVSRIDQGRVNNDPKVTDVTKVVKDIVQELSQAAVNKKVKLGLTLKQKRLPSIRIDQMHLHEVVQNLITNALEYTLPGGSVSVDIAQKGRVLVVNFTDTGIGIAEEDQTRLFSKFFRSEKAALQNPDGSGLGLYVVKSYVEEWGGKLTVRSHEGKGSTFTITVPIKEGGKQ
jgi:PAS domain S-box-containing protein